MSLDEHIRCSCGAVYTRENCPEVCTGTRPDGSPCRVQHFGSWSRVNAKIADAAKVKRDAAFKFTTEVDGERREHVQKIVGLEKGGEARADDFAKWRDEVVGGPVLGPEDEHG